MIQRTRKSNPKSKKTSLHKTTMKKLINTKSRVCKSFSPDVCSVRPSIWAEKSIFFLFLQFYLRIYTFLSSSEPSGFWIRSVASPHSIDCLPSCWITSYLINCCVLSGNTWICICWLLITTLRNWPCWCPFCWICPPWLTITSFPCTCCNFCNKKKKINYQFWSVYI